jgi:hypothetical protein
MTDETPVKDPSAVAGQWPFGRLNSSGTAVGAGPWDTAF